MTAGLPTVIRYEAIQALKDQLIGAEDREGFVLVPTTTLRTILEHLDNEDPIMFHSPESVALLTIFESMRPSLDRLVRAMEQVASTNRDLAAENRRVINTLEHNSRRS